MSTQPDLTDYVLGNLSPDERAAVEAQLATDPQAAATVRDLLLVADALRAAHDEPELLSPSPDVRASIESQFDPSPVSTQPSQDGELIRVAPETASTTSDTSRRQRSPHFSLYAAMAASVLICVSSAVYVAYTTAQRPNVIVQYVPAAGPIYTTTMAIPAPNRYDETTRRMVLTPGGSNEQVLSGGMSSWPSLIAPTGWDHNLLSTLADPVVHGMSEQPSLWTNRNLSVNDGVLNLNIDLDHDAAEFGNMTLNFATTPASSQPAQPLSSNSFTKFGAGTLVLPARPTPRPESDQGYFAYIEGPATRNINLSAITGTPGGAGGADETYGLRAGGGTLTSSHQGRWGSTEGLDLNGSTLRVTGGGLVLSGNDSYVGGSAVNAGAPAEPSVSTKYAHVLTPLGATPATTSDQSRFAPPQWTPPVRDLRTQSSSTPAAPTNSTTNNYALDSTPRSATPRLIIQEEEKLVDNLGVQDLELRETTPVAQKAKLAVQAGEKKEVQFGLERPNVHPALPAAPPPVNAPMPANPVPAEQAPAIQVADSRRERGEQEAEVVRLKEKLEAHKLGWREQEQLGNTEAYDHIVENQYQRVTDHPLSTFSIDVDTASYSLVRRFLDQGQLPPRGAVRIEELVNYFRYDYPQPEAGRPFSVNTEIAECPWNAKARLLRIGLQGREIPASERPASNLVFLLDVSGSMQDANKLPLVKRAMKMLVTQLSAKDRVAVVVYAGNSGLALPSTPGDQHDSILGTIDRLEAGGSTNGASGIQQAYQVARQNLLREGTNRVILCTDGDFNVGVTNQDELIRMIEDEAKSGVFLSALGFGMGNFKDATLEKLADKGNGNYAYIDNDREARKVLVEQMAGTLYTIAKDVKIQIEFNPRLVAAYRLVGYENRILAKEDFNNDKKDAGEIGAGHSVTALYEILTTGEPVVAPAVDPLKYQRSVNTTPAAEQAELLTLKLRYKQPDGQTSQLIEQPVADTTQPYAKASSEFKFAAAVAGFGLVLRDSAFRGALNLAAVAELAQEGVGKDVGGHRAAFVELVNRARMLKP